MLNFNKKNLKYFYLIGKYVLGANSKYCVDLSSFNVNILSLSILVSKIVSLTKAHDLQINSGIAFGLHVNFISVLILYCDFVCDKIEKCRWNKCIFSGFPFIFTVVCLSFS